MGAKNGRRVQHRRKSIRATLHARVVSQRTIQIGMSFGNQPLVIKPLVQKMPRCDHLEQVLGCCGIVAILELDQPQDVQRLRRCLRFIQQRRQLLPRLGIAFGGEQQQRVVDAALRRIVAGKIRPRLL